ncbi:MAG: proton-dependent oligopeptide transporter, family [Actinomycetota bacterium]|nr:proton-dependent oligopeptide transporter, family [Actinomycetota bacterium]
MASTVMQSPDTETSDPGMRFGHPRGLSTLFFTEIWERFSYYGMRALLVLFMTAAVTGANPGLGMDVRTSTAIYGLYTSMVYLLALPGGWVADKLWGQQRAVFVGGCIIASGHFTLAGPLIGLPVLPTFFLGLFLIIVGTGLLKPNVSSIVGQLYDVRARVIGVQTPGQQDGVHNAKADDGTLGAKRDAGFSIFYMGINMGAILGPFICGTIGEGYNYHWGFSAAGFGMLIGLVQYRLGTKYLGDAGLRTASNDTAAKAALSRKFYTVAATFLAIVGLVTWLGVSGIVSISVTDVAKSLGGVIATIAVCYFGFLLFFGGYGREDKRRVLVVVWLFVLSAVFWSGFEQAGSSMNLFAEKLTNRNIMGWEMPTTWLQNVNPIFIIILAPVFGYLWTFLARRNRNPSIPMKFALGLLGLSTGFFVLAWGSAGATKEGSVAISWLVVTYFLHTVGELCLSPVGLSSITKLAPRDRISQMMGLWFVATALGNLLAGLTAGTLENKSASEVFSSVAIYVGVAGFIAVAGAPFVKRVMGNIT